MNIQSEARALNIAPKYFYYTPRDKLGLLAYLARVYPDDIARFKRLRKGQLFAIYHSLRRKETIL